MSVLKIFYIKILTMMPVQKCTNIINVEKLNLLFLVHIKIYCIMFIFSDLKIHL